MENEKMAPVRALSKTKVTASHSPISPKYKELKFIRIKRFIPFLAVAGILIFFMFVIFTTYRPIDNGDFWFHLAVGRHIFETKSIPVTEFFSHTANGAPWVSHSWLYELILYCLFRLFSWNGIVIFKAIVSVVSYFILFRITKLFRLPTPIGLLILTFIHASTVQLWMDRPQIVSYCLISLVLYLLLLIDKGKISDRILKFFPFLFLVWGNLHAGIVIGLALMTIFWFIGGWNSLPKNSLLSVEVLKKAFFSDRRLTLLLAGIVSGLAGLINPNFYRSYGYFFIINPGVQNRFLEEWKSVFIHLSDPHIQVYFLFIFLLFAVLIFDYVVRKNPLNKTQAILLPVSLIFGLDALRNITLFCILVLPILSISLERIGIDALFVKLNRRLIIICVGIITVILFLFYYTYKIIGMPSGGVNWNHLPIGATKFLSENDLPKNIFNPYHLGGFLMWELYPEYSIFIDSRWDPYVRSVFPEYQKVSMAEPNFTSVLDTYKTDLVLIQNSETWGRWSEIGSFLENSSEWIPIYYDDFAALFLRINDKTINNVSELGYRSVLLYDDSEVYKSNNYDKARGEYQHMIDLSPTTSSSAHNRLGFLYASNSQWNEARTEFNHAIRINPTYAAAYYNLGHSYEEESGDYNAAIPYYKSAAQMGFQLSAMRLGQIYEEKLKYYTEAIEYYSLALKLTTDKNEKESISNKITDLQRRIHKQ